MCLLATTGQDGVASLGDHVAPASTQATLVSVMTNSVAIPKFTLLEAYLIVVAACPLWYDSHCLCEPFEYFHGKCYLANYSTGRLGYLHRSDYIYLCTAV